MPAPASRVIARATEGLCFVPFTLFTTWHTRGGEPSWYIRGDRPRSHRRKFHLAPNVIPGATYRSRFARGSIRVLSVEKATCHSPLETYDVVIVERIVQRRKPWVAYEHAYYLDYFEKSGLFHLVKLPA